MQAPLVLATLVYAIDGDRVLLHQRVRPPNEGLWVAPGGKLDAHESPTECAIREMREESGLTIDAPHLRGIMTEVSPRPDYQWMTFIFAAVRWSGALAPAAGIGEFKWVRTSDVGDLAIPPTDRIFFPRVLRLGDPTFLLKFTYDEELRITRTDES
ncbi:MAG TPA: 8-oxo-dGTP diphosphatase [Candidatus Limnocylindrales bacterium]|nr:8-oxo-dGTP diphosphatase [Candidatus Limnocylindrales bacterium]